MMMPGAITAMITDQNIGDNGFLLVDDKMNKN
jgi:hypothetical protein